MPKFLKPAPAQGGTPSGSRTFRYPAHFGGIGPSNTMACDPPALLRASLRRSSKFVTARPSPQPPRPAPPSSPPRRFQRWTLNYKWTLMVSEVPGTGQRHRTGASSGADFGFWRPSAREKSRRLGRFRDRRRFMDANITQRTILVASIHPRASPAIGQICCF